MPRFFPSLGRSKKNRERSRNDYAQNDYPVYDGYGQHGHQLYTQPSSAQRNVVPYMEPLNPEASWAEDIVEYPESYSDIGNYHGSHSRRQRPPVHSYSVHSEATVTPLDDHYGRHYGSDDAVPIVQRESSLSRLQEAFADHGASSRPVTQVNLPQPTPRFSPRGRTEPARSHPMMPAEVRNVYAESHQPVLVPNTSVHSVEPEFVRSTSQRRGRTEERHRSGSSREHYSRGRSASSDRSLEDGYDYPPCVVVVQRGRNGKKDTYYVIPGGAPVVFEDDEGRELTRVGDFSGRYKPQRQRPVIIEDEHGNEIGRLGFDDESSLDYAYRNRSEEDFHTQDREHNYRHGHRGYDDDRTSRRSHGSHRRDDREYRRREDPRNYSRSRPASPPSNPNVVYIPPSNTSRASSQHSNGSSRRHYEPSHHSSNTSRSYESSSASVIHLDDFYRRRPSGSVSSGSSGKRSYGSSQQR